MYRLYYSPGACSLAAHIILEEFGLPFELELRSALKGSGTQTPEYLLINPKGRVSALQSSSGAAVSVVSGSRACLLDLPSIVAKERSVKMLQIRPAKRGDAQVAFDIRLQAIQHQCMTAYTNDQVMAWTSVPIQCIAHGAVNKTIN
ncbi:hypothetical protein [Pseudomonas sp. Q11]|uniref:hypothetical protein n=1 Tax=Pseudomonas sp. Q11 TaxID=2968470 RepID=UPI003523DB65